MDHTSQQPPAGGYYAPQQSEQTYQAYHPGAETAQAAPSSGVSPIQNDSAEYGVAQQSGRAVPDTPPAYPPRPAEQGAASSYPAPPTQQQQRPSLGGDDINSPVHYTRDPHKLIAYLVPFPKPDIHRGLLHAGDAEDIPPRFMIYTPPAPPLKAPAEGEKEAKTHKVQRKWQEEVRAAKHNTDKITSWKGAKSKATRGISAAVNWTTTSNIDFLNRVPGAKPKAGSRSVTPDPHGDDGVQEEDTTKRTVGLEEMVLIYPSTIPGNEAQIREEFVNTMLRSKSKAQRDTIIATGLLPVSLCVDVLATLVWPFGGLLEMDGVWLASSFRGAKTARSVTKRLNSTTKTDSTKDEAQLRLTFTTSPRLDVLEDYLIAECHKADPKLFKASTRPAPTETQVLEAIGWSPSQTGGETKNWEDEQWEIEGVKDDIKATFRKSGKEWNKWCKNYEKDPEKALKK